MGIPERKEREKEARRSAILDAAEEVFRSKGFQNATMEDIAKQAELAKGTVYLYYRSKEELHVGLVLRGFDLLVDFFDNAIGSSSSPLEQIHGIGTAYWDFAESYPFYFDLMNAADVSRKVSLISPELVAELHERSGRIWQAMVTVLEEGKKQGLIKQEVNSFYASMLMWLSSKSVLYFHLKLKATPDSVWKDERLMNPCAADFREVYDLNGKLFLQQLATPKGQAEIGEVVWPDTPFLAPQCDAQTALRTSLGNLNLANQLLSGAESLDSAPKNPSGSTASFVAQR